MKKNSALLLLFWASLYGQENQQSAELQAVQSSIKEQYASLKANVGVNENGNEFLQALNEIKAQFTLLSQKTGLTPLVNQLRNVIEQECTFVQKDQPLLKLLDRATKVQQEMQTFMNSSDGRILQQLQKSLAIIHQAPQLTDEQEKQAQDLQQQFNKNAHEKMGPLLDENKQLQQQISNELKPFTSQINLISNHIKTFVQSSPEFGALRQKIQLLKNNPVFRWLALNIKNQFSDAADISANLYQKKASLEGQCVMTSPGQFISAPNLFELINQTIVEFLVKD